jgi:hypothetical protein
VDPATEEERGPDGTDMEERGAGVEAHVEDTEEDTQWRADAEEERVPTDVGK